MELRWMTLLSYLAAMATLAGWFLCQLKLLLEICRSWWFHRRISGRIAVLKPPEKPFWWSGILVSGIGILVGGLGAYGLSQLLAREALLLGVVVLLLLSVEFQPVTHEKELLAVLALIDRFRTRCVSNEDPFDILTEVVQELPEGEVQRRVRETIFRRRRGDSPISCLKEMAGIDPFLDEFILNLQLVDGPNSGPALALILARLQERAGRKWDQTSRLVLLKHKTRLPVKFSRAVLIAGGWVLLVGNLMEWISALLSQTPSIWLGGMVLALGLLIYLIQTKKWVRRALVVLILLISLVFYGSTLRLPDLTSRLLSYGGVLESIRIDMGWRSGSSVSNFAFNPDPGGCIFPNSEGPPGKTDLIPFISPGLTAPPQVFTQPMTLDLEQTIRCSLRYPFPK